MKHLLLLLCLSLVGPGAAFGLESDRDQPATIDANEVDIDFGTGIRVYTGNVKLTQGTLRLNADKLEIHFKDDVLDHAIAVGGPAEFRQRPDGKEHDVIGKAKLIHLDEVNNIITLTRDATMIQGMDSVTGKTIVYNMTTDKMQVRSGGAPTRTTKNPEDASASSSSTQTTKTPETSSAEPATDGDSRRPRIVLKPKPVE